MFSTGLLLLMLAMALWSWASRLVPQSAVKIIFFKDREGLMTAILTWNPSTSPGVTSQNLVLMINGTQAFNSPFPDNTTAQYSFACNPGDQITASLTATSALGTSTPVTVSGTAPSLPDPPANFQLNFGAGS